MVVAGRSAAAAVLSATAWLGFGWSASAQPLTAPSTRQFGYESQQLALFEAEYPVARIPVGGPSPEAGPRAGVRSVLGVVSAAYRLDPGLLAAVAWTESRNDNAARSAKGALGLMQVMPATARSLGVPPARLSDPVVNLATGAAYLSGLLHAFPDVTLALSAYNAGPGAVRRHSYQVPPYRETRRYVAEVLGAYRSFDRTGP